MSASSDTNALAALRDIEMAEAGRGQLRMLKNLAALVPVENTVYAFNIDDAEDEIPLRVGNPTAIPKFRSDAQNMTEQDEKRFALMANAWRGPRAKPWQSQYKGRTRTPARSYPHRGRGRGGRKTVVRRRKPYKGYARRYKYYNGRPKRTYMRNGRYRRYGRYPSRYRRR